MRRHTVTARGVTVSLLMDELREYDDALGALVESVDTRGPGLSDDQMESLTRLYTKIRTSILIATEGETLRRETRERMLCECDLESDE